MRPSKYAEFHPHIWYLMQRGTRPADIVRQYPDVPAESIRTIIKRLRRKPPQEPKPFGATAGLTLNQPPPNDLTPPGYEPAPDEPHHDRPDEGGGGGGNLVAIGPPETDFQLVRRTLRNILRTRHEPAGVKIQAARVLLTSIQMRAEIAKSVLNEEEQVEISEELAELQGMSDREMIDEYRKLLGS